MCHRRSVSANNVWEEAHEYSRVFGLEDKKQNNFFLSLPVARPRYFTGSNKPIVKNNRIVVAQRNVFSNLR